MKKLTHLQASQLSFQFRSLLIPHYLLDVEDNNQLILVAECNEEKQITIIRDVIEKLRIEDDRVTDGTDGYFPCFYFLID